MIEKPCDIGDISISIVQLIELLLSIQQGSFQLGYTHFKRYNLIILILHNRLNRSHIDIGLSMMLWQIIQIPSFQLSLHSSVLFLHIPNMGLKRTILFLGIIDHTFEVVIFIPYYVLSSFVAVQIDGGLEYVMIGVYLLAKMLFVANATV